MHYELVQWSIRKEPSSNAITPTTLNLDKHNNQVALFLAEFFVHDADLVTSCCRYWTLGRAHLIGQVRKALRRNITSYFLSFDLV